MLECLQQSQSSIERSENTHENEKENIRKIYSTMPYVWCRKTNIEKRST